LTAYVLQSVVYTQTSLGLLTPDKREWMMRHTANTIYKITYDQ